MSGRNRKPDTGNFLTSFLVAPEPARRSTSAARPLTALARVIAAVKADHYALVTVQLLQGALAVGMIVDDFGEGRWRVGGITERSLDG